MKSSKLIDTLALFLWMAGAAWANSTVFVSGVDATRGGEFWIRENFTNDVNAYGGVIFITLAENGQQFYRDTLCVDLFTNINLNTTYDTTVLRPDQVPGKHLTRASWLVDNALLPVGSSYPSLLPQNYWVTTTVQGMGIQLAIWDIVHDNGDGLAAGSVQTIPGTTNADVVTWATNYLSASSGKFSDLAYVYDNVIMGDGAPAQMLIGPQFVAGGPTPSPTPEPSTFVAGAGLLVLAVAIRRHARRQSRG